MVIFARTFDLARWLLPRCEKFPKGQRFGLTRRTMDALFDFQEALYLANAYHGRERLQHLRAADAHLNVLRANLRLALALGFLSEGQYLHVSKMVGECGALMGGWLRQTIDKGGRAGAEK